MDACTPEGVLERFTVSKKHGKDIYTAARKATWGDIFYKSRLQDTSQNPRRGWKERKVSIKSIFEGASEVASEKEPEYGLREYAIEDKAALQPSRTRAQRIAEEAIPKVPGVPRTPETDHMVYLARKKQLMNNTLYKRAVANAKKLGEKLPTREEWYMKKYPEEAERMLKKKGKPNMLHKKPKFNPKDLEFRDSFESVPGMVSSGGIFSSSPGGAPEARDH